MSKLSDIYVPSEGNKNARIFIVGEAPGADEEKFRRPFVGDSGQFLERNLFKVGIARNDVYLANLCNYKPVGNKFEFALGTSELDSGLQRLQTEINEIKPNVILALGNWPMYFLTGLRSTTKNAKPGTGISLWRGSIVPCSLVKGYKVAITYHPAYVVRPTGYENHPIFKLDIEKAVQESLFSDIRYPIYEEIIDPSYDQLGQLVDEYSNSEYVTSDIETFGNELACIGFCSSNTKGVCLTLNNSKYNWEAAEQILNSPAKKIFHYGCFDTNYVSYYKGWRTKNWAWDTYVAANNQNPGFPKTLAFLTSIYTRFAYYKEDLKTWRKSMDFTTLWKYNIKDVIATHSIALQQMEEIGWKP